MRRFVLGLIGFNAAIALVALLSGEVSTVEGQILSSSLLLSAAAVLAVLCVPAHSGGRLGWIPVTGMAAAGAAGITMVAATWTEFSNEPLSKTGGSLFLVAIAVALACVLSGLPLGGAPRLAPYAYGLAAAVAAMAILGIWVEMDSEIYWRAFTAVLILLAAASIAIPVLHWFGLRGEAEPVGWCPFCGAPLGDGARGSAECPECGRRFTVRAT